jgi:hypothetical protein
MGTQQLVTLLLSLKLTLVAEPEVSTYYYKLN